MGQDFSDFLPNFDNGVFLSYARIDDSPPGGFSQGWVTQLAGELEKHLQQLLVCESPRLIWRDKNKMRGGEQLTDGLRAEIGKSAVFLAVLSPGYVGKNYCMLELEHFVEHCGPALGSRLIIVEMLPDFEMGHLPELAQNSVRLRFFEPATAVQEMSRYGYPTLEACAQAKDQSYSRYYSVLNQLAESIKRRFLELGYRMPKGDRRKVEGKKSPAGRARPRVLVAEATDDLDRQRRELCTFLEAADVDVRPAGSYFFGAPNVMEVFDGDLAASNLYVQLLSGLEGKSFPAIGSPYVLFQHDRAGTRPGLPRLLWRDPGLDLHKTDAGRLREILAGQDVFSGTLESFKQELVRLLKRLREPVAPGASPSGPAMKPHGEAVERKVFLNANQADAGILNKLASQLFGKVTVQKPLFEGSAGAKRKQTEKFIDDCDAMILVRDKAPGRWAEEQLSQCRKVRTRAFSLLGLCAEQPEEFMMQLAEVPAALRPIRPHELERVVGAL